MAKKTNRVTGAAPEKKRAQRAKSTAKVTTPPPPPPVEEPVLTEDANEHPAADMVNTAGDGSPILPAEMIGEGLQESVDAPAPVVDTPKAPEAPEPIQEAATAPIVTEKAETTESSAEEFKARNPLTGVFNKEEREYVEIHILARKQAGITRDNNHFIRQCVNFCINYTPGWQFGRANVARKTLEE